MLQGDYSLTSCDANQGAVEIVGCKPGSQQSWPASEPFPDLR